MALNYIWIFLILAAALVGLVEWIFAGQSNVMTEILNSTFASAKTGFEISIGLTGVLSLWMGIMKIGERAGVINQLSRAVSPFFTRIFPELGKGHPAYGPMLMNLSATMLGIDNAATPLGLQAMQEMQKTNTDKNTASNAMIMFLVLAARCRQSGGCIPAYSALYLLRSHGGSALRGADTAYSAMGQSYPGHFRRHERDGRSGHMGSHALAGGNRQYVVGYPGSGDVAGRDMLVHHRRYGPQRECL